MHFTYVKPRYYLVASLILLQFQKCNCAHCKDLHCMQQSCLLSGCNMESVRGTVKTGNKWGATLSIHH